jgi:hypothetical protein
VTLYGGLNYFTGEIFIKEYEKVNAETFLDYLGCLRDFLIAKGYTKIYLILDLPAGSIRVQLREKLQ